MINIVFCGNDRAYDGIVISLLSICKHTKEPLHVYVLTADLQEESEAYKPLTSKHQEQLEKIAKKQNQKSAISLIDITKMFQEEMMQGVNMTTSYTPYIFLRLFADRIHELPGKILYLDNDIVCYQDIKPLYDMDVRNYDFAAVKDYFGRWFIDRKYINSGVLLLNLDKLRKDDTLKKCREMCKTQKMLLPDQTALNKYCKSKLYLPFKFNEQKKMHNDTVLRHYSMTIKFFPYFHTLKVKPWEIDRIHDIYNDHNYDDILEEYLKIVKGENIYE